MSEVLLSNLKSEYSKLRIDAEYFKKENISLLNTILSQKHKKIEEFAFITDGIHSSIDFCDNSNINLISAKSPKDNYFDLSGNYYISEKQHNENSRTALVENDVIISTVGTIGNTAVVQQEQLPANSDRHVGIIRIKDNTIPPYYLSTFLNSKYGRFQSLRESTGNVQLNLFIYKIKELLVPILEEDFQNKIQFICENSYSKRKLSQQKYTEAENLLLETLNLKDFQSNSDAVNIKTLKQSFLQTGRLDAEFYQKKYDEIETFFNRFERIKLADLVEYPISSGITPKAGGDDYTDKENGVPFIRAVDLQNGEVSLENVNFIKKEIHNTTLKRTQLRQGDVLISIAGTVGRCAIFNHTIEANINQAIAILRFNNSKVNKLYLVSFFNSEIGRLFVSKYARQGLQTNLNLVEVGELEIPLPNFSVQTQIAEYIQKANQLRAEAQRLLQEAKLSVENAIESQLVENQNISWGG